MSEKHPEFIIHEDTAFNGGVPLHLLLKHYLTPKELFFVRNHGDVPKIDEKFFFLEITGLVATPLRLSMDDLKSRFSRQTLTVTLQCAGNRRKELAALSPIDDQLSWGCEAIGTATWTGAPLVEVLEAAGVQDAARHVDFLGLDAVHHGEEIFGYGSSIPLAKALRPEVILAYEMNGEPLPALHGAPLRVIAPGYIGARSVKWLGKITVQEHPSTNYFQAVAYKLFPPQTTVENVNYDDGLMLGEQSINSVICHPAPDEILQAGGVSVAGYAVAGGERQIFRVDVSCDGGQTWQTAELLGDDAPYAWRLWRTEFRLIPGEHELVVRAWDTAANTQPETVRSIWNFKGYMNNAWHRVKVRVE